MMNYAPGDRDWSCSACGSSATLCRPNDYFLNRKRTTKRHRKIPEPVVASINLLEKVEIDPILSGFPELNCAVLETGSATIDLLQSYIQSEFSDYYGRAK